MRLVNPGLGELLDRLSILELKLAHGGGEQFEKERKAIVGRLVLHPDKTDAYWDLFQAYSTLAAVNAAIWQSEDALRDLRPRLQEQRDIWVQQSCFLAHKLQTLNDRRADLIREIGKLAGEEDHREKLSGGEEQPAPRWRGDQGGDLS